jgi:hypothetical protein
VNIRFMPPSSSSAQTPALKDNFTPREFTQAVISAVRVDEPADSPATEESRGS